MQKTAFESLSLEFRTFHFKWKCCVLQLVPRRTVVSGDKSCGRERAIITPPQFSCAVLLVENIIIRGIENQHFGEPPNRNYPPVPPPIFIIFSCAPTPTTTPPTNRCRFLFIVVGEEVTVFSTGIECHSSLWFIPRVLCSDLYLSCPLYYLYRTVDKCREQGQVQCSGYPRHRYPERRWGTSEPGHCAIISSAS